MKKILMKSILALTLFCNISNSYAMQGDKKSEPKGFFSGWFSSFFPATKTSTTSTTTTEEAPSETEFHQAQLEATIETKQLTELNDTISAKLTSATKTQKRPAYKALEKIVSAPKPKRAKIDAILEENDENDLANFEKTISAIEELKKSRIAQEQNKATLSERFDQIKKTLAEKTQNETSNIVKCAQLRVWLNDEKNKNHPLRKQKLKENKELLSLLLNQENEQSFTQFCETLKRIKEAASIIKNLSLQIEKLEKHS